MSKVRLKMILLIAAIVVVVGLWLFVLIAATVASFEAFRNGQDGWAPLAVVLVILYGGSNSRSMLKIISAIDNLQADLESTKVLSDAAVQAIAMQMVDEEVADKAQWN